MFFLLFIDLGCQLKSAERRKKNRQILNLRTNTSKNFRFQVRNVLELLKFESPSVVQNTFITHIIFTSYTIQYLTISNSFSNINCEITFCNFKILRRPQNVSSPAGLSDACTRCVSITKIAIHAANECKKKKNPRFEA